MAIDTAAAALLPRSANAKIEQITAQTVVRPNSQRIVYCGISMETDFR
jgi:hypothetical protein